MRFICVSTGGRILGSAIGANGMGIPSATALYACALSSRRLLPVLFDIGTTNDALRADPLYLGLKVKPPSEQELDELVEEFVQAVQQVFPNCCIHFEDWKGTDAIRVLARYRDKVLCYNDDIQGTASVTLAGLTTALQIVDAPLTEQRILFLGAGSGVGISNLIASARDFPKMPRAAASPVRHHGLIERPAPTIGVTKIYAHKAAPSKDLAKLSKPEANHPHRCQHQGRRFQPASHRGRESGQRAADWFRAFKSDRQGRVFG
jgi:malate dehydrogenase (oxaloacetate-decarboxylating)(NADP+)